MSTKSRFHQKSPRLEMQIIVECHAKPALFFPWDKMTKAAKAEFEKNGSIPCEGGGRPGIWCDGCRFGHLNEPEPYND